MLLAIQYICDLFKPIPNSEELLCPDPRELVSQFARGNIHLQRGLYISADDVAARRDRVLRNIDGVKDDGCIR